MDKWITPFFLRQLETFTSGYVARNGKKGPKKGGFPTLTRGGQLGSFRAARAREAEAVPGPRLGKCGTLDSPKLLGLLQPPPTSEPRFVSPPRQTSEPRFVSPRQRLRRCLACPGGRYRWAGGSGVGGSLVPVTTALLGSVPPYPQLRFAAVGGLTAARQLKLRPSTPTARTSLRGGGRG